MRSKFDVEKIKIWRELCDIMAESGMPDTLFGDVYVEEEDLIEGIIHAAQNGWGSISDIREIDFTDVDPDAEAWLLSPQGKYIDNLYRVDFDYWLNQLQVYLKNTRDFLQKNDNSEANEKIAVQGAAEIDTLLFTQM